MNVVSGEHILIHYGEVGLKRKIQPQFRQLLQRNIHQTLKHYGYRVPVRQTRGYLSIDLENLPPASREHLLVLLREIFGIVWYTRAARIKYSVPADINNTGLKQDLVETVLHLAAAKADVKKTYCVRVRRSDKRFPLKSLELEKELGSLISANTRFRKVNLDDPDYTFYVEIQSGEIYVYGEKLPGNQGLPVGSAGRVLVLLSGGIDSPVAAYLVAKRGCRVDFIHFTASHVSAGQAHREKISRLAAKLSRYTIQSRLYLVPYTYFHLALMNKKNAYELVLFRRFMVRVAEKISFQFKAKALVTGDNLSQVASQTIWNIAATVSATTLPVLQPLITYEKQEIINLAKEIETYEIAIEPYKDCCALISRNPNVASKAAELSRLENEIFPDYRKVILDSIRDMVTLSFQMGKLTIG